MERRELRRSPVRLPVMYSGDLLQGKGMVVDLSPSGCGVRTDTAMKDRTYLHLVLKLPHDDQIMKVELAKVRWVSGQSFGLEFIRIKPDHHRRIREYLNFLDRRPVH